MRHTAATAVLFAAVLASTAIHAGDCTTEELKAEAASRFVYEHYGDTFSMIGPADDDPGLIEVDFFPYYPPDHALRRGGTEWPERCTGRVRVGDDCGVSDAEGAPLSSAGARERAINCTLGD